jgi:ABC-type uncharacterized transport system permease subunit
MQYRANFVLWSLGQVALLSLLVWKLGERRYTSTGS